MNEVLRKLAKNRTAVVFGTGKGGEEILKFITESLPIP